MDRYLLAPDGTESVDVKVIHYVDDMKAQREELMLSLLEHHVCVSLKQLRECM